MVWAHVSLKDLFNLDADSALLRAWTERTQTRWAAARAGP